MSQYTTFNSINDSALLTRLANIFANGDLSYHRIAKMLNDYAYPTKQRRPFEAVDVRENFKRIYKYAGVDVSYVFPFLYITPNEALKVESAFHLQDASPYTLSMKYGLSREDVNDIKSGNFSYPIKLNDDAMVQPSTPPKNLVGHKNITGHKKEVIEVEGHEIDISFFSPIGKKAIYNILNGSLSSPKIVSISKGAYYDYWNNSYDYDDYEAYIKGKKVLIDYDDFCKVKAKVLNALSTIGMFKEGDRFKPDNGREIKYSDGDVRAIRHLYGKGVAKPLIRFFFNDSNRQTDHIIGGTTYTHVQ